MGIETSEVKHCHTRSTGEVDVHQEKDEQDEESDED